MNKREIVSEYNEMALFAEGFDKAIIGISRRADLPPLVTYDIAKCIEVLVEQGMSYDEAQDYFDYNVVGSYMGENTPIFVDTEAFEE